MRHPVPFNKDDLTAHINAICLFIARELSRNRIQVLLLGQRHHLMRALIDAILDEAWFDFH